MKKQVAVIGIGRFGRSVASALYNLGHDVLAIDRKEERVQDMLGKVTYPVSGDATNELTLKELGVPSYDAAIVAIGSDTVSIKAGDATMLSIIEGSQNYLRTLGDVLIGTSTGAPPKTLTVSGDISASGDLQVDGNVDFNDLPSNPWPWLSSGTLYTQSGSQLPFVTGSYGSAARWQYEQISASKFVLIK